MTFKNDTRRKKEKKKETLLSHHGEIGVLPQPTRTANGQAGCENGKTLSGQNNIYSPKRDEMLPQARGLTRNAAFGLR